MKKLRITIGLLLVVLSLPAQQVQYTLAKIETGARGTSWGAVPTPSGGMIFCSSETGDSKDGGKITRIYELRSGYGEPVALFREESKESPHMGSPYIPLDGRELYFAISGKVKSKGLFKSKEVYYPQQLAMSRRQSDGSWGPVTLFRYNMENYSSGDPWLSNDGQYLYFASNRPGGAGGVDLWRSRRNPDGSWAPPENLREINTKGDDRSPRFDSKDNFYFASNNNNGGGMGGLDLYSCAILKDGHFTTPVRMAAPVNSTADDFAIAFISETTGYISSNRTGEDAVYQFERTGLQTAAVEARIKVVDDKQNSLSGVQVYFMSEQAHDSRIMTTDREGRIVVRLEPDAPYTLLAYKADYLPKELKDLTLKELDNRTIVLESYPECMCPEVECLEHTTPGQNVKMEGVHFDYSKWYIRADAARELDKLVIFLKQDMSANVLIEAHTDCRGSDKFNRVLSQKRANAVKEYLVRQGIAARRIKAIGYGKTKLLNRCDCRYVDCSDEEHALNRRAEYTIIR
jgi:outer membrane protein OmpA-like peptidoglycan-associated protein